MALIVASIAGFILISSGIHAQNVAPGSSDAPANSTQEFGRCKSDPIHARAPMPGLSKPRCTKEGHYNLTQCSGSTGYCCCHEPETGEKFVDTCVQPWIAGEPNCSACHVEKANFLSSPPAGKSLNETLQLAPKCTANGTYILDGKVKPVQDLKKSNAEPHTDERKAASALQTCAIFTTAFAVLAASL